MTAEQWAQAEAEEQSNILQEIQRLRAEQLLTVPPVEPSGGADPPPPTTPAGRGIIDTRIGKPPAFSGDESTWGDWSFKLRSYVSVVDLQLGRMMEAAELAAHASVWKPSEPLNQDMDAQLRYLLVMLTSGHALRIIRQQPSGVQAFRDLARRYNLRSQARSLAQLQEIMHVEFGQEPAGVTDRLILVERRQVERFWMYKSNAPCFWREFHPNSGHTCCSPVVHDQTTPS